MTNEAKIITILESIQTDIKEIKQDQVAMQADIGELKQNQNAMQTVMEHRFTSINNRLDEYYQILKALEHTSQVHKAEIDKLTHKVTRIANTTEEIKSDVTELKTKTDALETRTDAMEDKLDIIAETQKQQSEVINLLATRSIHQEAEIQAIKRAI